MTRQSRHWQIHDPAAVTVLAAHRTIGICMQNCSAYKSFQCGGLPGRSKDPIKSECYLYLSQFNFIYLLKLNNIITNFRVHILSAYIGFPISSLQVGGSLLSTNFWKLFPVIQQTLVCVHTERAGTGAFAGATAPRRRGGDADKTKLVWCPCRATRALRPLPTTPVVCPITYG